MLNYFFTVAGNVITLFLMMGVGYFFAKGGKLSQQTISQMSYLLLYVVAPCIIIRQLQTSADAAMIRSLAEGLLALLSFYIMMIPISLLLFRKEPTDTKKSLQFGCVYGNTGFMGLPLLQAVFGDKALIYGVVGLIAFTIFQWTHGVMVMGGSVSPKKAILNPGIIGAAAGLVLFFTGLRLPSMMGEAVTFMGNLNTPLAMVVIGGQMASADMGATFKRAKLYLAAAIKLMLAPALTAVLLFPFHLAPFVYSICVVLAATPAAGVTAIFAQQFKRDISTAAQLITLTTLLSVITLPVWAVIAEFISTSFLGR
jgi:predicted permease